jgi:rod shape-determining protein MreB and related proteins
VGTLKDKLPDAPEAMLVKGKDLMAGLPVERAITPSEIFQVLDRPFRFIEEQIVQALEVCPPELSADIYQNGIYVTGGGALIRGIRARLENSIQVPIALDPQPLLSVSKGISKVLANPKHHAAIMM